MNNALNLTTNIKDTAKSNGVMIKNMLSDCGLSVNTLNQMTDKKGISCFSLQKIADYLGVSVDYLLGRTNNPEIQQSTNGNATITGNNIVNGNVGNSSSVNTTTTNTTTLDETAEQVLSAFQSMTLADKAKVITLIAELTEKNKTA